ncbi:MAG: hypothetical protein BA865_02385 [Desulfobacterales bacterium S5133MH4]|nr:MAG: hypothetical protein BA865_02385 [Desulfobacterales bacterium S5133MH4]
MIYAGSITGLNTIKKTGKGDVFIPGSLKVIKKAGGLGHRPYLSRYYVEGRPQCRTLRVHGL